MRAVQQYPLCPWARKVRFLLREKGRDFVVKTIARDDRHALNDADVLLIEDNGVVIASHYAICEYIEELYTTPTAIIGDSITRAECRRLTAWFDDTLYYTCTKPLLQEKVWKRLHRAGEPDSTIIRAAVQALRKQLQYLCFLLDRNHWLVGETFSLADMAGAAHISVLDYLGDIDWDAFPSARLWYARIKSRPGFRPLLNDTIGGMPPPDYYTNPDF